MMTDEVDLYRADGTFVQRATFQYDLHDDGVVSATDLHVILPHDQSDLVGETLTVAGERGFLDVGISEVETTQKRDEHGEWGDVESVGYHVVVLGEPRFRKTR